MSGHKPQGIMKRKKYKYSYINVYVIINENWWAYVSFFIVWYNNTSGIIA